MDERCLATIREINKFAKERQMPRHLQSYTTIYNLVKTGKIPIVKLGNRYLLRIADIEKYLTGQSSPVTGGIRRID